MQEVKIDLTPKQLEYRNSLQAQIQALQSKLDGAVAWWISEAGYAEGKFQFSADGMAITGTVPVPPSSK